MTHPFLPSRVFCFEMARLQHPPRLPMSSPTQTRLLGTRRNTPTRDATSTCSFIVTPRNERKGSFQDSPFPQDTRCITQALRFRIKTPDTPTHGQTAIKHPFIHLNVDRYYMRRHHRATNSDFPHTHPTFPATVAFPLCPDYVSFCRAAQNQRHPRAHQGRGNLRGAHSFFFFFNILLIRNQNYEAETPSRPFSLRVLSSLDNSTSHTPTPKIVGTTRRLNVAPTMQDGGGRRLKNSTTAAAFSAPRKTAPCAV